MAKVYTSTVGGRDIIKHKRPGIHAKTRVSKLKTSKHYVKAYRGQGR